MKKFQVQSIRIVSRREKSARRLDFHPRLTVIRGANDTGKSSLLKSIYWTFGADPAVIDDVWKGLDIASVVEFKVDDIDYAVVRHQDRIAVFDSSNRLLLSTSRITSELAPFLARLFDFQLLLNNRSSGKAEVPPPAFSFLPYYIDQDKGWVSSWSSFGPLGQYSDWQSDVAEYHVGLRNNEYFRLKTELKMKKSKLDEPTQDERALRKAFEQIRIGFERAPVDFDIDQFKKEIEDLLREAKPLADQEEKYRIKIGALGNRRVLLQHQLDIVSRTISELDQDYDEALQLPDNVECPTCGATYDNSIREHFKLLLDEDHCQVLANDIRREIQDIEEEISGWRTQLEEVKSKYSQIWEILEARQGEYSLQELLTGEARKQAMITLKTQLDSAAEIIASLQREISTFEESLKSFSEPGRKKEFLDEFSDLISRHCVALNVASPSVKRFYQAIRETGSDRPRSILAHNYAVLKMKWKHSDSVDAPLIIDSPNQQDQDLPNLKKMLEFIRDETPKDVQLILGLVDPQGISFDGKSIVLEHEKALLRPDEYNSVGREIEEYLAQMYSSAGERGLVN